MSLLYHFFVKIDIFIHQVNRLGHATSRMLLDVYSHASKDMHRRATEQISKIFGLDKQAV
jgi:hypothetical protein